MAGWTDVVQALAAVVGVVISIAGFGFLYWQIRQVANSIRTQTHADLTAQSLTILERIGEWPATYPYLYERKRLSSDVDAAEAVQVKAVAEMVANYLDNCCQQDENMTPAGWQSWRMFVVESLRISLVVRDHVRRYPRWYCDELHALVLQAEQQEP